MVSVVIGSEVVAHTDDPDVNVAEFIQQTADNEAETATIYTVSAFGLPVVAAVMLPVGVYTAEQVLENVQPAGHITAAGFVLGVTWAGYRSLRAGLSDARRYRGRAAAIRALSPAEATE